MSRVTAFAWVCLVGACSSTPDLVYQATGDGSAPDATTSSDGSTTNDSGTTPNEDGGEAGIGDAGTDADVATPADGGVDAPVDAPPDGWNTCPTPPGVLNLKCCPGANNTTACLGPCDDPKCQECADAGCGTTKVCCTQGGPNPSKCINYGAACP